MYEVIYPDNVRMGQFEAALCLALKLIKRRTILNHQILKKFQGNIALQFFIACEPDNSHSDSPEDLDQCVASKNFLSAGKLTRSRAYDIACAFVTHFGNISVIKKERKVKAGSSGSATSPRVRAGWQELASTGDALGLPTLCNLCSWNKHVFSLSEVRHILAF